MMTFMSPDVARLLCNWLTACGTALSLTLMGASWVYGGRLTSHFGILRNLLPSGIGVGGPPIDASMAQALSKGRSSVEGAAKIIAPLAVGTAGLWVFALALALLWGKRWL